MNANIDDGAMSRDRVIRELSEDAFECRFAGMEDMAQIIEDFRDEVAKNVSRHNPIKSLSATHERTGKDVFLYCYSVFKQKYHLSIGDHFSIRKQWERP